MHGTRRNARRRRSRREVEEMIARLLTFDLSYLTPRELVAARLAAYLEGVALAELVYQSRLAGSDIDEGACGDIKDYRRTAVRRSVELGVIEPLDAELWRYMPLNDPRLVVFKKGYCDRMRELDGS